MDRERLSEEEVAARAGSTVERIRELVGLGILAREEAGFARREVMRARVVADLERRGIETGALAAAIASGELTLGYLESAGRRPPRSDRTFEQFAAEMGLALETLQRLFVAFGLPHPTGEERIREEDLEAIRAVPLLLSVGVGEGALLQLARVFGDGARRIAQYQTHYFHATIEEAFRRRGYRDNEAFEAALREVGLRAGRSGEILLSWLFRRHAELAGVEHQFEHVETALEHAGVRQRAPRTVEAVAFADLTGYTSLTERSGDQVAADVSLRFAQLVSEIAATHRGQVVKMLGDGVYFHFRDPGDAVAASLDLVRRVRAIGLPPAHVGVNAGPLIYDEGDYFGRTVNLAARIAAQAGADQVFVGESVVRTVTPKAFRFVDVGELRLKGIAEPVRIHEVAPDHSGGSP
jgi:adenylate cyclase